MFYRDKLVYEPAEDISEDDVMTQREAVEFLRCRTGRPWTLQMIGGRLDSGTLTAVRRLPRDDAYRLVLRREIEELARRFRQG